MPEQEQLELDGIIQKEIILDQVEASNIGFVQHMRDVAQAICREKGRVCSDDLRRYAHKHHIKPQHHNAWGAIFRGSEWQVVGHTNSQLKSNHGREIRWWVYKPHPELVAINQ